MTDIEREIQRDRHGDIYIYIYILVSQSMVHLFPVLGSAYGPPPGQLVVHLPFGTIKIVVWEQFWQDNRGWSLNEIIGFFGCRLLKIVAGHCDGREKRDFL